MKTKSLLIVLLGMVAFVAALGPAAPTHAQQSRCPKLADVEWWTNSVSEVRRLVVASYDGNWDAYIARWEEQRQQLQKTYDSGGAIEIKSRGLIYRDDDLKNYIDMVDDRIMTLHCLKKEFGNERAAKAAPKAAPPPPESQEVKAVEGQNLDVEIATDCRGGTPTFTVTNLGDRWPRLAEVSIYRTDNKGMLVQRRVRMTNSQQLIFNLPANLASGAGEVGIFIEPSWYQRPFAYDALIKCN